MEFCFGIFFFVYLFTSNSYGKQWWHTCVQGENANEDELFMPREELSLSAIVEKKEWCLIERSEIRQSFWTEIKERESFPRQGKCPSGQFLSLDTCMSSSGDSFFSIFRGCSNHKSTIIIAQQNLKRKISGDFFSNFFPLRDRSKMMPFLNSSIKA